MQRRERHSKGKKKMKNIKRRIGKIKNKKKWENEKLKNKIKVKKKKHSKIYESRL